MTDITEIMPAQLAENVAGERPVLIEFIKKNCPWCARQKSELSQIATEWNDRMDVVAVHVDDAPELVAEYRLRGAPTLVLLSHGKRLGSKHGFQRAQQIRPFLRHYLDVT